MGDVIQMKEAGEQMDTKAKLKKAMQTVMETTHLMGASAITIESQRPDGFKEMMEDAKKRFGQEWLNEVIQEFLDEQEQAKEEPADDVADEARAA